MMEQHINIFHHPTTAIFIDDCSRFLDGLPLVVDEDIAQRRFFDPERALRYINDLTYNSEMQDNNCIIPEDQDCNNYESFKLNLEGISERLKNKFRFFEASVLIVDYAMPGINGLEFCRKVKNKNIKKILLTGVADDDIAAEALNNRDIDYYIKKNTPNVYNKVNEKIRQFQNNYFSNNLKLIRSTLKTRCHFFEDAAFVQYFMKLMKEYQFFEYYFEKNSLRNTGVSFLLLDYIGKPYRLSIYTEELVKVHIEYLTDNNAPEKLIKIFDAFTHYAEFPTEDGFYDETVGEDWEKHLFPTQKIEGQDTYYVSLAPETSPSNGSLYSFQEYLLDNDA